MTARARNVSTVGASPPRSTVGASPPRSTVAASPDTTQTVTGRETVTPATGRTTKEITEALTVTITDQAGTVEEAASQVGETLNVRVDRTRIVTSEVGVVTTEDMIAVTAKMTKRNSLEATVIKAAMTNGTIHRRCRITGNMTWHEMAGRVVISNMHIQTVTGRYFIYISKRTKNIMIQVLFFSNILNMQCVWFKVKAIYKTNIYLNKILIERNIF